MPSPYSVGKSVYDSLFSPEGWEAYHQRERAREAEDRASSARVGANWGALGAGLTGGADPNQTQVDGLLPKGAPATPAPSVSAVPAEASHVTPLPPVWGTGEQNSTPITDRINDVQVEGLGGEPARSGPIQFSIGNGPMRMYNPGGATRSARLGQTFEGPTEPDKADMQGNPLPDGGPAASVLPELTDYIPDSALEDRGRAAELARSEAFANDPFADKTSELGAALAMYQGKGNIDSARKAKERADYMAARDREDSDNRDALAVINNNPALAPKDKEAKRAEINARYMKRLQDLQVAYNLAKETISAKDAGGLIG